MKKNQDRGPPPGGSPKSDFGGYLLECWYETSQWSGTAAQRLLAGTRRHDWPGRARRRGRGAPGPRPLARPRPPHRPPRISQRIILFAPPGRQAVYTRGPHNYIQQITCNMDYNYCFPNRILRAPSPLGPVPSSHPLDSVTLASVTRPSEQRHGLAEKFHLTIYIALFKEKYDF